ncbi:MAG: hypothetical protein IPO77_21855 [Acidobacteria bacterium]|nr:hypothetical protein [Acidobacteriota bacterium]
MELHKNLKYVGFVGRAAIISMAIGWLSLSIGFVQPQLPQFGEKRVELTRDFVIAIDISGSMDSGKLKNPYAADPEKADQITPKMLAQLATQDFVQRRMDQKDRVGLFVFDDQVYYSWLCPPIWMSFCRRTMPLPPIPVVAQTSQATVFAKMGPLQAAQSTSWSLASQVESRDHGHRRSGQHLGSAYGRASELYLKHGYKIYVLGIGEEWLKEGDANVPSLAKFSQTIPGSMVIGVGNAEQMKAGFELIDSLEKSSVEMQRGMVDPGNLYQYFILAGLAFVLLGLFAMLVVKDDM